MPLRSGSDFGAGVGPNSVGIIRSGIGDEFMTRTVAGREQVVFDGPGSDVKARVITPQVVV